MTDDRAPDGLPPRRADALLRRVLPEGEKGRSIIGDLHQEFGELRRAGGSPGPRLWYWRNALGLSAHYLLARVGARIEGLRAPGSTKVTPTTALLADFRFAARMLVKTPLLSLTAIVTLGIGVGLSTQTFSAVYGSILRGLPVPGHDRLMALDQNRLELDIPSDEMSIHDFLELRRLQTSFEDVAAFYQGTANLAGDEGLPERFAGAYVTANALTHLGVPPFMGRVFLPGEDDPDAQAVVVLGYHVWRDRFGRDESIVGKTIRVNGETTEVVGVMPEGFKFPFNEDLWLTHRMDVAALPRGGGEDLDVFGRLREGVSVEAARDELGAIAAGLAERFPETNTGVGMGLQPYGHRFMPRQVRAVLMVMLLSTLGVLLIACANVANLLLARASRREKEVAIRTAIGASRFRVIRQLMVEAMVLAALGGSLGFALGIWGLRVYNSFSAGINRPYWIDPTMEAPVLLFGIAVTAIACVVAGSVPAFRASGVRIGEILKDQARGSSSLRIGRLSTTLVVSELAVSCALLVGAGFMVQSVINVGRVELGFDPTNVISGRLSLFEASYPTREDQDQFFTSLKERLEAEPGIISVSLGTHLPGLGSFTYFLGVEGVPYPADSDYPTAAATVVGEDYFRTFNVEFVEGRDFNQDELRLDGDPAVIVNQSFARRFLPEGRALGSRIRRGVSNSGEPWMRVVGVVPDMHVGGGVGGLGDDRIPPQRIYLSKGRYDHRGYVLAARTQGPPEAMAARIREVVAELDPNLPVYGMTSHDEAIKQATWAFKLFGVQFTVFGVLALFLAAVGLYGVMAFSVSQRRREMGLRMALGAQRKSIVGLVMARGAKQVGTGMALGLAMGAAMGGPLSHVLYGVETRDLGVYLMIAATLGLTGLLACFFPARTATRADPMETMRIS